jgi:hypothetical protein
MPRMLAPTPYAQFQAKSGAAYTADAKGQIANVALGDVVDLLNSGCLFSTFSSNLTLVHGRNADGTALDATGGAGKFKLASTVGTSLNLAGEAANTNTKTDQVLFEMQLGAAYETGTDIAVTVNAKVAGAGTPGTKTIQAKAYRLANDGTEGAQLGSAALAITTTSADYAFTITGATLAAGDRLLVVIEAVIQETGGTNINAQVNSVRLS